jgi:hypothetical protein
MRQKAEEEKKVKKLKKKKFNPEDGGYTFLRNVVTTHNTTSRHNR